MNRRRPSLRSLALTVVALASLLAGAGCRPEAGRRPRNVVLICIDTLRTDRLPEFGGARDTSPYLRRLSLRGTSFASVQSSSNWTVPAVGSIFTGLRPARHGAVLPGNLKNLGVDPAFPNQLRDGVETLPEILNAAGFRTGLYSGNPYLYGRFRAGFETATVASAPGREHLPQIVAWLEEADPRPFFLYWQIMDLHQPLEPPRRYESLFVRNPPADYPSALHRNWGYHDLTPSVRDSAEFQRFRELKLALYDATLRHVDDLIRELLERLDTLKLASDTLVVVTADHGEEFWDHALEPELPKRDPRGYWGVGHGQTMFQELLHVPMIWVGPAIPARSTVRCPASLTDLFPTLLATLGLPPRGELDGESLAGFFENPLRPCPERRILSESPAYGPESWALRAGRWKLIRREGEPSLLFDLGADPHELRPASGEPSARARAFERALERLELVPDRAAAGPRDPELEEQLRALGYLR